MPKDDTTIEDSTVNLYELYDKDPDVADKVNFVEGCLWDLPKDFIKSEWGYCCDVLEHIPTKRVDDVLRTIARHSKAAFLQIAHFPDGEWVEGTGPLHLTVEPPEWWAKRLRTIWRHVEDITDQVATYNPNEPVHVGRTCWLCRN